MGFYLRKSFSFGPLRLNLSKSGLGYSFGVKGARIGTGPRGNYIHMGRYGLYYRQYFNSSSPVQHQADPHQPSPAPPDDSTVIGTLIPTADATALKDGSAEELLEYIRGQHKKAAYAPWITGIAALLLFVMLSKEVSFWMVLACAVLTAITHLVVSRCDAARKRVVLQYRLDDTAAARYGSLSGGLQSLASSHRLWRIITSDLSYDRKYTAGAGHLISRKSAAATARLPSHVEANISVWALDIYKQTIYFFPDRALVYQGSDIGAIPYAELSATHTVTRFIESEGVPGDARTVGATWQYVNKAGGPDRRFANNPQIPIAEYAEVHLASKSGLNIVLQCSNVATGKAFVDALCGYCATAAAVDAHHTEIPALEDAEPIAGESTIATRGWLAAPVLLVALLGTLAFGPREHYFETSATPQRPAAETEKPLPQIRLLRQKGSQISVAVPSDTSDADLRRVVEELRVKVESSRLSELGVVLPKQAGATGGTISIYRTDAVKPTAHDKSDATLKWSRDTTTATLRDAAGKQVPLFGSQPH